MIERAPFAAGGHLAVPYNPWAGADAKNARILDALVARPERLGESLIGTSTELAVHLAARLTDPHNLVWEVWQNGSLCGILVWDHLVERVDARWHFAFFDDALAARADFLRDCIQRHFAAGFERLSLEIPAHMSVLQSFAKRRLGFRPEGVRTRAYFDGATWHNVAQFVRLRGED